MKKRKNIYTFSNTTFSSRSDLNSLKKQKTKSKKTEKQKIIKAKTPKTPKVPETTKSKPPTESLSTHFTFTYLKDKDNVEDESKVKTYEIGEIGEIEKERLKIYKEAHSFRPIKPDL